MEQEQKNTQQQQQPETTPVEEKKAEENPKEQLVEETKEEPKEEKKVENDPDSEDEDAEKAKGSWWGSSWGSGWGKSFTNVFNTVKEVTTNVAEMCVADLKDFSGQIQEDTTNAINQIDTTQVKKSALGFWGQVSSAFTGESEPNNNNSSSSKIQEIKANLMDSDDSFDDNHKELEKVILKPPEDKGKFEEWKGTFNLQDKTEEIAQLLASEEPLRRLHTHLVPAKIPYKEFWENYYYQRYIQEQSNTKRLEILDRVTGKDEEEELGWGDDDEEEGGDI